MAVRNDVSIDFTVSPRIIEVADPSTAITVQDLYDTIATEHAKITNLAYDRLCDAAGKADLGGSTLTVVTLTLRNALLQFEARGSPPAVVCRVTGGNLVALDSNGDSVHPIQATANTHVTVAQATTGALLDPQLQSVLDRLGTPAGTDMAADIAAVKSDTGSTLSDTGTIKTDTSSIQFDTTNIRSRIPTALVSGKMDSSLEAINGTVNVDGETLLSAARVIMALLAGVSSGGEPNGSSAPAFRSVDGTKVRVSATVDAKGNRTSVQLDGT